MAKWKTLDENHNNKATINSLIKMLKEDNEEMYNEYKKIHSKKPEFNFKQKITSSSIANHFKTLYGNKFIYQNNKLYFYNGVYWKCDDEKFISLNKIISNEYYNYLIKLLEKYQENDLKNVQTKKKKI